MPIHDWTQVESGIFHDFHTAWISEIRKSLNDGLLPSGYYALAEQHVGGYVADVLTLHTPPKASQAESPIEQPPVPTSGAVALAEAPPIVDLVETMEDEIVELNRTLSIRHISTHRVVAMLEIVSPGNKDQKDRFEQFISKTIGALERGVHVVLVDLFPPGTLDPTGIHGEIRRRRLPLIDPFEVSEQKPLTLVSYLADHPKKVFLNRAAVGDPIPVTSMFLTTEHYINLPLEETYNAAYAGMPAFWRDVLEGKIS